MADNINLPNLVSHLAVNLDGISGAVADASRQGSSMGAALGRGVNQQLDALLRNLPQVTIDGNSDPIDRDLARIHQQLAQLDSQRIGVDISMPDALRQIDQLQASLQRIGDEHPNVNVQASTRQAARQLDELLVAARRVDDTDVRVDVDVDEDRPNRLAGLLGRIATAGAKAGLSIAGGMAKATASFGAAVPAVASVVSALANVAPAAGVAVTAMAAVQLASGAVKLAAVGMSDALSAALDPSKAKDYAKALEKLSPEARRFAEAVHEAQPALHDLQQDVQDKVFDGLAGSLQRTATSVLPVLRTNLLSAAGSLNTMGKGVLTAARDLGKSGTLGTALDSASAGLRNLTGIPGLVVTSLGQIAAAAGPSFESLTAGAGRVATQIGDRLGKAFESGAMQDAIENAVSLLGQLADVAGNVGSVLGSVFSATQASGGGLIGTLQQITGALATAFASPAVQSGLTALFTTMATLASTVAPLLGQALGVIAPVLTQLGPPVQTLIGALGDALSPIIAALGPVLVVAASAVGTLVEAVSPLLPVVGQLVAALLPALTPLLQAAQDVFAALAPVVETVAGILLETLSPILAALPGIIGPLADLLAARLVFGLQLLGEILLAVGPSLVTLGETAAELLVAFAPLIEAVASLVGQLLKGLMPILTPIIQLVGGLAAILVDKLAAFITTVVVPAVQFVAALLTGDFSGAMDIAKRAALDIAAKCVTAFQQLPGKIKSALGGLASALRERMADAATRMLGAARAGITSAASEVGKLPGKAATALGNLNRTLISAGSQLIQGLIDGIVSKFGAVQSTLGDLTGKLTDWKGPPAKDAKILTPAGRLLIQGFIKGIDGTTAQLKAKLASITKALPANVKSGYGKTLAKATAQLEAAVAKRDVVLTKLAAGQKKLDALVTARDKAASDITKGILDEANITSGHTDVNSVSAITVGLQQALQATQAFQANIAKLKKAGIRSDLLQEIADAGVSAGGATAAALAKATPAELKKINDLQAQLAASATSTGNTVGDALYSAGINAAKGLVAGLKSQEKAIEASMARIAKSMLTTVKKVHKTKSPSRAFREIGVFGGMGLEQGFLAMAGRVRDAARSVAGAALDVASGASVPLSSGPTAGQIASVYAGGASGDQNNTFNLYGSEASPDGILRALSWQGLVGGR